MISEIEKISRAQRISPFVCGEGFLGHDRASADVTRVKIIMSVSSRGPMRFCAAATTQESGVSSTPFSLFFCYLGFLSLIFTSRPSEGESETRHIGWPSLVGMMSSTLSGHYYAAPRGCTAYKACLPRTAMHIRVCISL